MAESPKSQVLRILESKWDTLAFANAPIKFGNNEFRYRTNGIVWWCNAWLGDDKMTFDFCYDTHEDWPLWAKILDELKTLKA